jgi:hypothetical protein
MVPYQIRQKTLCLRASSTFSSSFFSRVSIVGIVGFTDFLFYD